MKNWNRTLIAVAAAGMLAAAAGPALAALQLDAGIYRVQITSDPPVIPMGRARLRLGVRDQNDTPVVGARVAALAQMPGMPMGEREEEATPEPGQPGIYVAPAVFGMEGGYQITVKIAGPQGAGTGSVMVSTGQNTAGGGAAVPLGLLLALGIAGAVLLLFWRAWRAGWRPNVKAIANRQVILGCLLLVAMFALSVFAVGHWRRKGAMTPIEAQAANMTSMPPPVGQVAVALAEVERGPVAASVRYSGTAMGFNEQDIYPRTQGWMIWMPFYAGDHVRSGQLLARLDDTELSERVREREASQRMAQHTAMAAEQELRQSQATAAQSQAEIGSKQGLLRDAEQQLKRAQAMELQARHELTGAKSALEEARESLAAAEAERSEAQADLAAAQAMLPDADAQLEAAKADQVFMAAELQRSERLFPQGVVAASKLQKDRAAAQAAVSRVSQAEARTRQAREQVRAAESKVRRAEAMQRAANERIAQMQSRLDAGQARIDQSRAEVAGAAARIAQAQADVEAAKAGARAMQAAATEAEHHVRHAEAGIAEAQAAVASQQTVKGYTEIRSLVDGVITQRNISPGVLVGPGQAILKVAQIRPIRIQVNVPEQDLASIRKGDRVRIIRKPDGVELVSSVSAIFPAVDPSARTGIVEALLPNGDDRFLPGQFVTMEIITAERRSALRVPSQAILWRTEPSQFGQSGRRQAYVWLAEAAAQGSPSVYTCPMHQEVRTNKPGLCPKCKMDLVPVSTGGKWKARRVDVTTGVTDGRLTEILSGVKENDHVVLSGLQNLHDGDALFVTNEPELKAHPGAPPAGGTATPRPPESMSPPDRSGATLPAAPTVTAVPPAPAGTAGQQGKYYCPMHPEVTSNDPNATCPKCGGMKLQPRPGATR